MGITLATGLHIAYFAANQLSSSPTRNPAQVLKFKNSFATIKK